MKLLLTTSLVGGQLTLTATLPDFSPLPTPNVFIYENNGSGVLGPYQGVAQLSELTQFQIWNGAPIPVFANNFVLSNQAVLPVTPTTVAQAQSLIQAGLTALKQQYLAAYPNTISVTI